MLVTEIILISVFAGLIIWDIITYFRNGVITTESSVLYKWAHAPIFGPIFMIVTGGLLYHLFICPVGCG